MRNWCLGVSGGLCQSCFYWQNVVRLRYSGRFTARVFCSNLFLVRFLGDHDDGRVRPQTWRRRFCPRSVPFGVLGDLPEFEPGQPHLAAQHPSLGVELAVTCPQGPVETPLWPSHALGCPWPHYKPRHGDQAPCPFYQAPYGRSHLQRHRRDPPRRRERLQGPRQHTYARPARPSHAYRTPSQREATSSRRRGGGTTTKPGRSSVIFFYDKT